MNLTDALRTDLLCHEEIRSRGEARPCNRPAVGVVDDPGDEWNEPETYPVCARHVRRTHMATLADMLTIARGLDPCPKHGGR